MASDSLQNSNQNFVAELAKNLVAGLAVSFVAISLGAAFGILSTRGAFAGILSAGIIALITGLFGGTRIQTSGPTAPMTAVTVLLVAYAGHGLLQKFPGADPAQFINLVLVLCGGILLIAAVCRLGRFIQFVPRVVISGFMSGIAILIWLDQTKKLFGIGGQERYDGPLAVNISVALAALAIAFAVPIVANRFFQRWRAFIPPGTLVAIAAVTIVVQFMPDDIKDIQMVETEPVANSVSAWVAVVQENVPTDWSPMLQILSVNPFEKTPVFQLLYCTRLTLTATRAEYLTGLFIADLQTVSAINREFARTTDQSCLNRFLTEVDWDVEALNERRLDFLQQDPAMCYSEQGVIAIDNVLIDHTGKCIEDVGWFWDHRRDTQPKKVLVTNRVQWEVVRILKVYRYRWTGTETFHRDGKQELGMGACQLRSGEGQTRHMDLVMLAYSLLMSQLRQGRAQEWALCKLTTIGESCRAMLRETLRSTIRWAVEQATQKSRDYDYIMTQLAIS